MTLDAARHKNILIQILKDISTDTSISPFLGFKGGTAVYMFYGLDRFSVDLDFDLLDDTQEEYIFERIGKILAAHGTLKEARKKRYSLFFLLSYEDKAHNIKVEVNRRKFGSKFEIKSYLGISMQVMVQEDMFAHKLVAMVERMGRTNRDIYDVWFFLKNRWPINWNIVEARTEMSAKEFLPKCIAALEKLSNRNILSGIGELLNEKQKVWAKTNLKTDTLFLLKVMLDGVSQ
ncbi:MAG: nucleotidyl transferase AbiEii/AbiGii toxin family protein [Deltaproteobacteria bacterium]|nr:nucleotidyl transferase AbiEii/AbiGii toxin family protein [Deltaproteobacteria bacterium]